MAASKLLNAPMVADYCLKETLTVFFSNQKTFKNIIHRLFWSDAFIVYFNDRLCDPCSSKWTFLRTKAEQSIYKSPLNTEMTEAPKMRPFGRVLLARSRKVRKKINDQRLTISDWLGARSKGMMSGVQIVVNVPWRKRKKMRNALPDFKVLNLQVCRKTLNFRLL